MYNNIIFVGGIHGVSKSTVCNQVSESLGIKYLSASDVLRWRSIKSDYKDKKVENIDYTQEKLINGLSAIISSNEKYILDGHFCLFNLRGEIEKISIETFNKISPILICNIIGDYIDVAQRLNKRDNKIYNAEIINDMQQQEQSHGQFVAKKLEIPYIELFNSNANVLMQAILNL